MRPFGDPVMKLKLSASAVVATARHNNSATFTGLIVPSGAVAPTIGQVDVELYNIFPVDSNAVRAITVPTRANSPSDVDFASRGSAGSTLSFTTTSLASTFTAANSVLNGIHPSPNQNTLGEGAVTGTEVQFNVNFTTAFDLAAGHYFFIPQVQVTNGEFEWLSAPRPTTGTPFPAGITDLQAWVRNGNLDPDWLRVGTDIVGGTTPPTFNMAFSLSGTQVPEPGTFGLMISGLGALILLSRCRTKTLTSNR